MNYKKLAKDIIIFMVIILAFSYLPSTDDTDKSRWTRSGMILYTDYATGLQYVKGGFFGSMVPRLDINGKHMKLKQLE